MEKPELIILLKRLLATDQDLTFLLKLNVSEIETLISLIRGALNK